MSALLDFLNEMFGASSGATFEDIRVRFSADLGVDVQFEDDLYLFKYDMINVKWNPVTLECRGAILTYDRETSLWRYVSRPPDKFFNLREGHGAYSNEAHFKANKDNLRLVQKADGTAIQMYFWKGSWKISTLGKITPLKIGDYDFTFADMFWRIFKGDIAKADTSLCYFHELCTAYNMIVTQYAEDSLFLLTARNVETGEYASPVVLDRVASEDFSELRPISFSVKELGIETLEDLERFTEKEATDLKYGKNSEGFVLSSDEPLAKLKNIKYLALHRVMTGSKGYTINSMLDLFFTGTIDDFYSDLTPAQKNFIDAIKAEIRESTVKVETFFEGLDPEIDKKSFALSVNANETMKKYSGYLFTRFVATGTKAWTGATFSEWLIDGPATRKNWLKFEDRFKSLFTIEVVS